jgi:hypothetical protein
VRLADEAAQVGVAGGGFGEESDVVISPQRDFRARDRLESPMPGLLSELHGAVEPVVIGEGQSGIAQLLGAQDQLLRVGGAVQEREAGMAVEFDVGHDPNINRKSRGAR